MRQRIILLVSASVLLSTLVVGAVAYWRIQLVVKTQGQAVLAGETRMLAVRFEQAFFAVDRDLRTLSGTPPIRGIQRALASQGVDLVGNSTLDEWRNRLETIFSSMMATEPSYMQVRFISFGNEGQELVRADNKDGGIRAIPADELQKKAGEPYYRKARQTQAGQVVFSNVTFNREFGARDPRNIATLRAVMPILGVDGDPFGFLVINIDYEKLLKTNFQAVQPNQSAVVTTTEGDYFIYDPTGQSPVHARLEMHGEYRVAPPRIVDLVSSGTTPEGLFEFEENVAYMVHLQGRPGIELPKLGIILQVPKPSFELASRITRRDVLLAGGLMIFVCVLAAALAARRMLHPLKELMDSFRQSADDEDLLRRLPITRQDELGDLARSLHERSSKLLESEIRADIILSNMLEGVILFDASGRIQKFNQAAEIALGVQSEEVIGTKISRFLNDDLTVRYGDILQNAQGESMIGMAREMELLTGNGTLLPVELSVNSLKVLDRKKYSCVFRNIRERWKVEQMKTEFVSTVSHELRTPLTSVRGSLDLVTSLLPDGFPQELSHMLRLAQKNTERLILLVNDILDFEKLEAKKTPFRPQICDLQTLLKGAVELHEGIALERSVGLSLENELPDAQIEVDPERFQQIMANFISNAVKFSSTGSEVAVKAEPHNGSLRISVKDRGEGIPDEFKRFVFTPFTQADGTATREKGGTGLGLAIAKRLTEGMGGKIGFDSRTGDGCSFWIDFPEHLNARIERGTDADELKDRLLCLHLEDDQDFASVLSAMMSEMVLIKNAPDLATARELISSEDFDLFIIDIGLSAGNGLELLNDIPERAHKPIIVVTANDSPIDDARVDLVMVKSKYSNEALVLNLSREIANYRERVIPA